MDCDVTNFPNDPRDRRRSAERRTSARQHYAGPERRLNATDRRLTGVHAIARSFGLRPEHLEAVSHDEGMEGVAHCSNCESLTRKCAELEARLAESLEEIERYRSQSGRPRSRRRKS